MENGKLLDQYATHDPLTGMPNRALFDAYLARACQRAGSNRQRVTVLLLDLDDFKPINSSLGYQLGDELLIAAGKRIKELVGDRGIAARVGGDEFGVLLSPG